MFGPRTLAYSLAAVVLAAGGLIGVLALTGGDDSPTPSATTFSEGTRGTPAASGGAAQTAGPESFILNEIRLSGDTQFIELKNTSNGPATPAGLRLAVGGQLVLVEGLQPVAPGGLITVVFDGADRTDGTTVHAASRGVLGVGAGSVVLEAGDLLLDRAAWGEAEGANVYLGTGGRARETPESAVIARPTGAPDSGAPWNYLGGADGSPGEPNPPVAVSAFANPDGGLFLTSPTLAWYGVPGAVSYMVEVAADSSFSAIAWKTTVAPALPGSIEQLSATAQGLAGGRFSWRVTATYSDGSSATSRPQTFRTQATGIRSSPATGSPVAPAGSGSPGPATGAAPTPVVKRVEVEQIYQRKDTGLLHLQNPAESGALAWDKPDAEGTHNRPYCAPAALAMLANKFGGRVSVDRFRHEAFRNDSPGPEDDLQETGFLDGETNRAAAWAFSPAPVYHRNTTVGEVLAWAAAIRSEIDAGRPMMAGRPSHMFLIVGYTEDDGEGSFAVLFKDGNGIEMLVPFDASSLPSQDPNYRLRFIEQTEDDGTLTFSVDAWWTFAAGTTAITEEDSVENDTDGDGVRDFDETERFKTSPFNMDSDADGVHDKEEIRASVWDPEHGYRAAGAYVFPPRDHDRDGLKMEMDPDSDNGGCFDGLEDIDHDGHREEPAGETSVFKPEDDACISGTWSYQYDSNFATADQIAQTQVEIVITLSMRPGEGGDVEGTGSARFGFESTATNLRDSCVATYPRIETAWAVTLTGHITDGVLSFRVAPPFETIQAPWTACLGQSGTEPISSPVFYGWDAITFTDGVYQHREEFGLGPSDSGRGSLEVKLEKKEGGGASR